MISENLGLPQIYSPSLHYLHGVGCESSEGYGECVSYYLEPLLKCFNTYLQMKLWWDYLVESLRVRLCRGRKNTRWSIKEYFWTCCQFS